jgi:hypothetical protein
MIITDEFKLMRKKQVTSGGSEGIQVWLASTPRIEIGTFLNTQQQSWEINKVLYVLCIPCNIHCVCGTSVKTVRTKESWRQQLPVCTRQDVASTSPQSKRTPTISCVNIRACWPFGEWTLSTVTQSSERKEFQQRREKKRRASLGVTKIRGANLTFQVARRGTWAAGLLWQLKYRFKCLRRV